MGPAGSAGAGSEGVGTIGSTGTGVMPPRSAPGVSGTGTKADPIVLIEELDSATPVTLTIRTIRPIKPFAEGGDYANGILYMRINALNNSGKQGEPESAPTWDPAALRSLLTTAEPYAAAEQLLGALAEAHGYAPRAFKRWTLDGWSGSERAFGGGYWGSIGWRHDTREIGMWLTNGKEYRFESDGRSATDEADLVIAVGARFDDRATGNPETFCRNARIIHVDIDPRELGKIKPIAFGVVCDAGRALAHRAPCRGHR